MPSDNERTDLFEMRSSLDDKESDIAEDMSEMQEPVLERQKTVEEVANYRIRQYEFGKTDNLLSLEYFEFYWEAMERFDGLCENSKFVNAYGKFVTVELCKAYPTESTILWEVTALDTIYPE